MVESLLRESNDEIVALSYRALGIKPVRLEILRLILARGETSAAHLMAEFGLSRNGVLCHLRSLTAAGLLHERHDTHPRGSGPITYWSADAENASIMLDTLLDYMTGIDP
ncbi:ArsR/SmtB family transcription factor [Subtercola boreus]|uniref:HTH arsR-type domain-containing protein n=1 Tax=Subtercola boreus TaxID=120213 RepID=A0A3E0W7A8_9MICO|nr:winged helix-turn-helix domain-containing protein [Subtercola boreus]RFA18837.1 hypothetical protein B7R24_13960 [Subtercola boreus]RFA18951.1 hypothetical protein B7R23_13950 [Subtercola boreus]RFA25489.1 hypothetical protein B7R25_14060 [Subtercola boreus]